MSEQKYNVYARRSNEPVARTENVAPDVNVDFDEKGDVVGVEILGATDIKGDVVGEVQ